MGSNSRTAVMVGGAAFILSFIIGLVSGVQVGAVLLRALLCAVGFAALSVLVMLIFSRFLQTDDARYDDGSIGEDADMPASNAGNNIDFYDIDDGMAPAIMKPEQTASFLDNTGANEANLNFNDVNHTAHSAEYQTEEPESAVANGGLEQKNDIGYTHTEEQSMLKADTKDGFSFNMSDFVPGLSTSADAPPLPGRDPASSFEMGSVEMSVGKSAPGKQIELRDLGNDADGQKIARTIQTLLKKDEG